MKLTLIQEQVLQALAHAQAVGGINAVEGVSLQAVQRALALRRPRKTSERYIAQILNELINGRKLDGHDIVEKTRRRPSRYRVTAVGMRYAWRRLHQSFGLEEDRRRWDELHPERRELLLAAGWSRSVDGLWRRPEQFMPRTMEDLLEELQA